MPTVVLRRNAKSDWPDGVPDESRPLSQRGERDARAVGRWLAQNLPDIDLALVSPAERAPRTWLLAAAALDPEPEWRTEPQLYYKGADGVVAGCGDEAQRLVGRRAQLRAGRVALASAAPHPPNLEVDRCQQVLVVEPLGAAERFLQ